ncbi:hypothetical protein KUTeg_007335 [Tegillarca granosa]|uniref:Hemimethylated DNA-binding domain-containing protein n=1 Tax=Tegillarca granosa TaxID=220873 RepID=A0ABQ9FCZ8_TEGGR|nr:hypothetical protein KUTeg_007335 [Tegillarca granosa]
MYEHDIKQIIFIINWLSSFNSASLEPRTPRPPEVKYRIGQVIRHKIWGYRGVIIGWDPKLRHWRDMPNYSILVDIRDRMTPQMTYIPEENIEIISNMKIYQLLKYKVDDGVIPALTNRVGPISYKSNNVEKFNICGDTCVFYFLLINTYLFNISMHL